MPLSGKEVVQRLKKADYEVKRINGSHHVLSNGQKKITVPVHKNKDMKLGLLKKIEKETGVKLS
jgi:predicted RNA binding protein YcfA (HicA-like mRNA interferase family)